jgi:hypothetical protein
VPLELTDIAQQKSKVVQDLRGEALCIFNRKGGQRIRQVQQPSSKDNNLRLAQRHSGQ